ncbi:hypothetical protein ACJIZ3_011248 [Penstemon smallii]|uniref:Uncharacterized protein n=1 Tax=Penstemon smallii TaxID=265156 RepID=A0ABD3UIK1_9LAMI
MSCETLKDNYKIALVETSCLTIFLVFFFFFFFFFFYLFLIKLNITK